MEARGTRGGQGGWAEEAGYAGPVGWAAIILPPGPAPATTELRTSTLCPSPRGRAPLRPRVALGLCGPGLSGWPEWGRDTQSGSEKTATSSEATLMPSLQKQLHPGWQAMPGRREVMTPDEPLRPALAWDDGHWVLSHLP